MGEASRRQKLDPNYGKVPDLRTQSLKYKHLGKICSEFIEQFQVELTELFEAETVPENYQTVKEEVRLWFKEQLLTYRSADRAELAKLLFHTIAAVQKDDLFNPLLISCIFKAVKEYLTQSELQVLLDSLDEDFSWSSESDITDPCTKFAYEEMVIEAKLSLTVD